MQVEGIAPWRSNGESRPWDEGGRVIVVSNRGPIQYSLDSDGRPRPGRGSGGVATALADMRRVMRVTWIVSALTEGDRLVAAGGRPVDPAESVRMHFIAAPAEQYNLYYNVISNPILWYLQHGLWDRLERPQLWSDLHEAWDKGYRPLNEAFGEAVCEELSRPDSSGVVLFQDYQLYLAPRFVRECAPDAVLQHFVHIPWPAPEAWRVLPREFVTAICDGLLANDSVRFHTQEAAYNFLMTCHDFLPAVHIDLANERARYNGRWIQVRADPIALDVERLRRQAAADDVAKYKECLKAPAGIATIVRVDRLDPIKNIVAGFQAYELLLSRRPELKGKVRFLSFLVPSRSGIPEYKRYAEEVFGIIDRVNERHGKPDWQPIEVFYENNHAQALAGMALYDVLLVNSIADGMNLVSLEGPIVNERDGVLVLSNRTGSYDQLREGAIAIEPEDVEATADAVDWALSLPQGERRRRARMLREAASARDLRSWIEGQFEDLATLIAESRRRHDLIHVPDDYRVAVSA